MVKVADDAPIARGRPRFRMFSRRHRVDESVFETTLNLAVAEAAQTLEADPHLRRLLAQVEVESDLKRAYDEIDHYVATAVQFYLRNRSREQRVSPRKVSCVSVSDLGTRQARCTVTVVAGSHMRRKIIDLELPKP